MRCGCARRYNDGRVVAMQGQLVDAFYFVLFGRRTHTLYVSNQ